MLKKFISYYKPHRKMFFLDMGASLLIALISIIYPVITRRMLNQFIPDEDYKMIIIAGAVLLIDILSFIVYVLMYGFPK